jgi:DNA-binding transcriptional regulator YdaS (Cro superfamily)
MTEKTKQDLLRRAAALVGKEELASRLAVPPSLLDAWMSGHASMPDRKLLVLADLLDKVGRPEKG